MSQPPKPPPPGWHADPGDPQLLRWWDGSAWTPQTQPAPGPAQGPQPPYPGPQPGPVPPGSRRARKSWPGRHKVLTGLGALVVLIIIGSIAASGNHPSSPPAPVAAGSASAPASAAPAATSAAAVPPSPSPRASARTVATFSGSGQQNTPRFTVTDNWKLDYSFDCSSFGSKGNFQVYEDGGSDFSVSVNDLAMSKSASTNAYGDGGTHYLEINSECSWKVKVVDEP